MTVRVASKAEALRLLEIAERQHGFPMEVTYRAWKPRRTDPQNRYLMGVAYPLLAQAKGYDVEDIHEWMCGHHFGWKDVTCPRTPANPLGIRSVPVRTTTRNESGERDVLKRDAFSQFVEMVQRIGAQAGVFIPDPEPSDMPQSNPHPKRTTTTQAAA